MELEGFSTESDSNKTEQTASFCFVFLCLSLISEAQLWFSVGVRLQLKGCSSPSARCDSTTAWPLRVWIRNIHFHSQLTHLMEPRLTWHADNYKHSNELATCTFSNQYFKKRPQNKHLNILFCVANSKTWSINWLTTNCHLFWWLINGCICWHPLVQWEELLFCIFNWISLSFGLLVEHFYCLIDIFCYFLTFNV